MEFASAASKLDAIKTVKEQFDNQGADYKDAKKKLEVRVAERDTLGRKLKDEHASVNKLMEDLNKLGADIKIQMKNEQERFVKAIEALQALSSNDLTQLVDEQNPSNELISIMNGVMLLLGKPIGWQSVQETIMSQGFMHSIGHFDYKTPSLDVIEKVKMWKANFNSSSLKSNFKAARAFALWVVAINICASVHQESLPALKLEQEKASKAAESFNKNQQKLERLSIELNAEADKLQTQADELQALHAQITSIGQAKIRIH